MRYGQAPTFQVPRITPAVKVLLIAQISVFLLQLVGSFTVGPSFITQTFGFVPLQFISGYLWQIVTYSFLHGSPTHLLFNALMLFMLGPQLEAIWGTRRFVRFYVCAAVGGAFLHLLIWILSLFFFSQHATLLGNIPVVGSSGAIYGLFAAYGLLFGETYFLVFFVFPMKAKHLVLVMGGIALISSIFYGQDGIAHLVHLGGLISGFIYLRFSGPRSRGGGGGWWPFRKKKMTRDEVRQRLSVIKNEEFGDKGHPIRWN